MTDEIIPPPQVIQLIDNVIASVIKCGDEIIPRLIESDKKNNFSFLNNNHPFYNYFAKKLDETRSNDPKKDISKKEIVKQQVKTTTNKTKQVILPPSFSYKAPPGINGLQLDTIHLLAQYAALHSDFIQSLFQDPETLPLVSSDLFSFLHPDKEYFSFFRSLVEQYKMAIQPNQLLKKRLEREANSIYDIYESLKYEAEYNKTKMEEKRQRNKSDENENYDFVKFNVVYTITLNDIRTDKQKPKLSDTESIRFTNRHKAPNLFDIPKHSALIHPQRQKELEEMMIRKAEVNSSLASGEQVFETLEKLVKNKEVEVDRTTIWDGRETTISKTVSQEVRRLSDNPTPKPELKKKPEKVIGPDPTEKNKT